MVEELALGDEVAVADWDGEPLARGELALALAGTVRAVTGQGRDWRWLAARIDEAGGGTHNCWFDIMGQHALAASVTRPALASVLQQLAALADTDALRWEYVTASRHPETPKETP